MLPWSVMPIAGWPSAAALATSSSSRAAPSSIENSVWTWRWVNESAHGGASFSVELQRCGSADIRPSGAPSHRTGRRARRVRGTCRGDRRRAGRGPPGAAPGTPAGAGRELAHLLELLAGGQLLGEQGRLDAVEQALEPADELGLGDAQLGVGRHLAVARTAAPAICSSSCRSGDSARTARRPSARRSRPAARGCGSSSGAGGPRRAAA